MVIQLQQKVGKVLLLGDAWEAMRSGVEEAMLVLEGGSEAWPPTHSAVRRPPPFNVNTIKLYHDVYCTAPARHREAGATAILA